MQTVVIIPELTNYMNLYGYGCNCVSFYLHIENRTIPDLT